ncbi:MAG: CHAP domain-containing protein [Eubacterium sp.]|uniref:CHAP domain-containing protein n=1 Tax=Eubacteriales TaxID=186802 RepID=UPI0039962989
MSNIKIKQTAETVIKTSENIGIVNEKIKDVGVRTKEKINNATEQTNSNSPEQYAVEKMQEKAKDGTDYAVYEFNRKGRKSVEETKKNIETAKMTLEDVKARRKAQQAERTVKETQNTVNADVTFSAQAETPKPPVKNPPKQANNTIKTANAQTVKATQKVSKKATEKASVKAVKKSAETNAIAVTKTAEKSRKAAEQLKQTAKETKRFIQLLIKSLNKALKAAYTAAKSLVSAVIAGGWVSIVVIILLCLFAALASSFYGIFFSTETSETGMDISSVIQEINNDYDSKIDEIKSKGNYDEVEINGIKANWKDILAVYAVKVTTDKDNPMEIATIDESKKSILLNIFWDMNIIDTKSEERTKTEEVKSTDEHGNEIITVVETKIKVLTITILGKMASEIASQYYFDDEQNKYLDELMSEKKDRLWASIIFNLGNNTSKIDIGSIDFGDETVNDTQKKIVAVATNYQNYGISAGSGYCQAWVADVYQAVTGSRGSAHCALCAADMWAVSSDWSKIPVGATVYGYASNLYGHVGIYIGNGQVIHNLSGTVKVQSLESWVKNFNGFAWGWENGKHHIKY